MCPKPEKVKEKTGNWGTHGVLVGVPLRFLSLLLVVVVVLS